MLQTYGLMLGVLTCDGASGYRAGIISTVETYAKSGMWIVATRFFCRVVEFSR